MKKILLTSTMAIALMFSTVSAFAISNSNNDLNPSSVVNKMQSGKVKKITIQFHGKEKKVSNKYRVISLKKLLNSKHYIRTPKEMRVRDGYT